MLTLLVVVFIIGYAAIAFEHSLNINKSATALITGVLCWTIFTFSGETTFISEELQHHLGGIASILFFLLGAMTVVELIDAHDGFDVLTSRIQTTNKRKLLLLVGVFAFFLSAVLDNLTTAIVMVAVVKKLIPDQKDRFIFGGVTIIAANAGGAWSPIGDVTTTMLWIAHRISSAEVMLRVFLPALVSCIVPLLILVFRVKGNTEPFSPETTGTAMKSTAAERNIVFWSGLGILILVPVFKTVTHLEPYLGMLLGVGILWLITELIHKKKNDEEKHALSVAHALRRIDTPSVLFFFGILLAVAALESTGILHRLSQGMAESIGNIDLITITTGLASAIIDNVPLVAGAIGMYPESQYGLDHYFWHFLAYAAGTGGSILIIGSAAGVAVMGLEKISFGWYLRNISLAALAGYAAGALVYIGMGGLF